MFATQDLDQVLRYQTELRHTAAQDRLQSRSQGTELRKARSTRRVFGLRLSLA